MIWYAAVMSDMRPLHLVIAIAGSLALCASCKVEGGIKASTDDSRTEEPVTAAAPTPQAVTAPAPPPPPRTDACPVTCFEPQGSLRVPVTNEELSQLRSALDPMLSRMHTCTSDEDWRRRGSPVINLRIAPDGTLNELGVDPHHGLNSSCFEEAGRSSLPSLSLPARHIVRCVERCVRDVRVVQGEPRRRGRGRGR